MNRTIHILVSIFLLATALPAATTALEIRVRARATIEVEVSAAGTVAQVSGALRDDLNRGLPQREVLVTIDSLKSNDTVVSSTVHTDSRGRFGVQEELPPGDYEVFVRFDETEHLDGIAHSDSLRLEPKPVHIRAFAPSFVYGRENPAWVSARANSGTVPYQGWAQVLVNGTEVGRMELDASGRGTFDVAAHVLVGDNEVTVRTPGSAYRDEAEASVDLRFSDGAMLEAKTDERLERLQRGLAVSGRVFDEAGPLEGVRIQASIEPVTLYDEDVEPRTLRASTVTDDDGNFVAFVPATKLSDGVCKGRAEFLPPLGDPVRVDAGSAEVDTRAFRWAVNGFGLTAILLGFLALIARGGQVFWAKLRQMRKKRERAEREQRALEEVETIVPVFFEPDEVDSPTPSRNDIGGVVWDVWQERSIPGAEVVLAAPERKPLTTTSDERGRFRFEDVPSGEWSLVVKRFGYIRGQLTVSTPHDGRMSFFRLDLVAVPLKIRRLYGAVLESSVGEDLWGRLSPREIEERLETVRAEGVEEDDRRRLRQRVLEKLRSFDGASDGQDVLGSLTEVVEESYFSGRTYGEPAFLFARALALDIRGRAAKEDA